ncbi:hypothetical protein EMIHUDRAFT_240524 [Emiliania huxleyi CCMP1516]|uniref:STI1/HOP DP domain-containing protein n=2 Tax=Emiliania huxleyi TaxID=2903 RepID=A0A0D3JF13_EMIH1|nr:hypothetical protein EMIHUDRAFT_240524 [Emiliania huxleyi CCMP1516]EOD22098.1 hypothetical protein EMIHUDRAFT_240524 [Emiliania huxleyi CCMP1516]|eukprot:XP_005774527.1 hypothetical protein EMIHUDRAFT_240524 [Emiliania huxleyi CCMP1516]
MAALDNEDEGDVPPLLQVPSDHLPAPAPPPAPPQLLPTPVDSLTGALVEVHSLSSRPELNGAIGSACSWLAESGRYEVRIMSGAKPVRLCVRPANLRRAPPEAARRPVASGALPVVRGDGRGGASTLQLPEVQSSMAEAEAAAGGAVAGASWVTPELLAKVAADPLLRKAFTDARCAEAMEALQTDPKSAMERYGHAFLKLMGEHFSALGEEGAAREAAIRPAAVETAEERSAREAADKALRDPEVVAILQEPRMQALLQRLHEGRSLEVEAEMRAPDTMRKLRRLAEAGLIGMHFGSP